jgi:4-amino-4-deoxy-L-arabinose transferase-like glycosyltransferase
LFFILAIAIYLRFKNLPNNPGWYSDEGTLVEVAQNLTEGKFQYLAINKSTLIAARLPLFPSILALIFSFVEYGITPLRYLSAGLGVITVGLLYWVVININEEENVLLALTTALFLAIYPPAILYSRLGFSYNLLAPLVVILLWLLYKYLQSGKLKWVLISGFVVGLGSISDLMMFTFAPVITLIVIYKRWKDLFLALGMTFLPFAVYCLVMFLSQRDAFMYDFNFTFFRLGEIPLIAQYPYIVFNYAALIFKDYWWTLGVIGLFILSEERIKYLALILFFVPVFMLARTASLPGLGLYYLSPVFPIIAFGAASLIFKGTPYALKTLRKGLELFFDQFNFGKKFDKLINMSLFIGVSLILFLVVISPFIITLALGVYQAQTSLRPEISPVLVDVNNAQDVIDYVNFRVKKNDLVLASPAIAWAIDSNAADFQMAIASKGGNTKHFPNDIPQDRFSFDPDYEKADYIIIDPIWINWAVPNMVEVELMVENVKEWPLVYSSGQIEVYQNPGK